MAARVPHKVSANTTKPLHDYLDATNYTQLHPLICSAHIKQSPPHCNHANRPGAPGATKRAGCTLFPATPVGVRLQQQGCTENLW